MKLSHRSSVELSTVTPMRNERPCVAEFVRRVDVVLSSLTDDYEIVIVNDGSTDGTGELLDELAATNSRLRPVHLHQGRGQAAAVDVGFQHSSGEFVVMLDGDLEQPPEEIPRLLAEARRGFDLVSGWRWNRNVNRWFRLIPSHAANWLLRRVTGCSVRDMGGIKCLRGDVARTLRLRAGQHRLLPALVHVRGGRVSEIPVTSQPRFAGRSHYGIGRTVDVLLDVANLWCLTAGKGRPIYWLGRMSLLLALVTGLLSAVSGGLIFANRVESAIPILLLAAGTALGTFGLWSWAVGLEWLTQPRTSAHEQRDWNVQLPAQADNDSLDESARRAA